MAEVFSIFLSLCIGFAAAAVLSRTFFGDYREGFRMLYHWIASADVPSTAGEPEESTKSTGVQLAYVAAILLVTVSCYATSVFWFRKLLHE